MKKIGIITTFCMSLFILETNMANGNENNSQWCDEKNMKLVTMTYVDERTRDVSLFSNGNFSKHRADLISSDIYNGGGFMYDLTPNDDSLQIINMSTGDANTFRLLGNESKAGVCGNLIKAQVKVKNDLLMAEKARKSIKLKKTSLQELKSIWEGFDVSGVKIGMTLREVEGVLNDKFDLYKQESVSRDDWDSSANRKVKFSFESVEYKSGIIPSKIHPKLNLGKTLSVVIYRDFVILVNFSQSVEKLNCKSLGKKLIKKYLKPSEYKLVSERGSGRLVRKYSGKILNASYNAYEAADSSVSIGKESEFYFSAGGACAGAEWAPPTYTKSMSLSKWQAKKYLDERKNKFIKSLKPVDVEL